MANASRRPSVFLGTGLVAIGLAWACSWGGEDEEECEGCVFPVPEGAIQPPVGEVGTGGTGGTGGDGTGGTSDTGTAGSTGSPFGGRGGTGGTFAGTGGLATGGSFGAGGTGGSFGTGGTLGSGGTLHCPWALPPNATTTPSLRRASVWLFPAWIST